MVRSISITVALTAAGLALGCFGPSTSSPTVLLTGQEEEQQQPLAKPVPFDGKRAMGYLKAICDIGPRMSGTKGMKKQQELILKHFAELKIPVKEQKFQAKQRSKNEPVPMTNLIASIAPEKKRRVIFCTHYDTRPIADQEPDPRKWREPFLSANDGASGVAWLMEIAHHLRDLPLDVGVDLVFFDGEEYIWDNRRDADMYFFGSKQFAKAWAESDPRPTYVAAILLDMIAGKNVRIPFEGYSRARFPELCDEIWGVAKALDCKVFKREQGEHVIDDHTELMKAGIPAIDLIDFNYPHWHRLTDTPENCSPEGMLQVSKVLSVWVQRVR